MLAYAGICWQGRRNARSLLCCAECFRIPPVAVVAVVVAGAVIAVVEVVAVVAVIAVASVTAVVAVVALVTVTATVVVMI